MQTEKTSEPMTSGLSAFLKPLLHLQQPAAKQSWACGITCWLALGLSGRCGPYHNLFSLRGGLFLL